MFSEYVGYAPYAVGGYLLGSFPSAFITSRLLAQKDIRTTGSGNVGGMNAFRNVGVLPGILTALLDAGKGALAVSLARQAAGPGNAGLVAAMVALVAAVLGHNYMLYLGFRGGKGLGASLGGILVLWPAGVVYLLAALGIGIVLLRDGNAGTGAGVMMWPFVLWYHGHSLTWLWFGLAMGVVILSRHRKDFAAYRHGRRQVI